MKPAPRTGVVVLLLLALLAPSRAVASDDSAIIDRAERRLDRYLSDVSMELGNRWAEAWVTYDADSINVHIGVVHLRSKDRKTLEELAPRGIDPQPEQVRLSMRRLRAVATKASRISDRFARDSVRSIGLDSAQNEIDIVFNRRDRQAIRALRRRLPDYAIDIRIRRSPGDGLRPGPESSVVSGSGDREKIGTSLSSRGSERLLLVFALAALLIASAVVFGVRAFVRRRRLFAASGTR